MPSQMHVHLFELSGLGGGVGGGAWRASPECGWLCAEAMRVALHACLSGLHLSWSCAVSCLSACAVYNGAAAEVPRSCSGAGCPCFLTPLWLLHRVACGCSQDTACNLMSAGLCAHHCVTVPCRNQQADSTTTKVQRASCSSSLHTAQGWRLHDKSAYAVLRAPGRMPSNPAPHSPHASSAAINFCTGARACVP